MTIDPISESLRRLVKYFDSRKIPYVVVGGVSVFVLGRSRLTMDIDIILDHTKLDRNDFVTHLKNQNFDISLADLEGFDLKEHCTIFYKTGMFRIDLKGVYTPSEKESIDMAIDGVYNNIQIKINHPINVILYKLKFGSEQDYEDALAVFIRNKERIDIELLEKKASKMKIMEELDSFLKGIKDFLEKEGIE